MQGIDTSALLRDGLLGGVTVALASGGEGEGASAQALRATCASLGASVLELCAYCEGAPSESQRLIDTLAGAPAEAGEVDLLVLDGYGLFEAALRAGGEHESHSDGAASRDAAGQGALSECLQACWNATAAVVEQAFLAPQRSGRVVLVAPAQDRGEHARAAGAALENLARTLSIEWARHSVTTVAIKPTAANIGAAAALVAYLASPAGSYYSGCAFELFAGG